MSPLPSPPLNKRTQQPEPVQTQNKAKKITIYSSKNDSHKKKLKVKRKLK